MLLPGASLTGPLPPSPWALLECHWHSQFPGILVEHDGERGRKDEVTLKSEDDDGGGFHLFN
jgi:hypothetical protein